MMSPDFIILRNLLSGSGRQIDNSYCEYVLADFWEEDDTLTRISFFLYHHNISNAISYATTYTSIPENLRGIAKQTDDLGQVFFYHIGNGLKQLLYAQAYTAQGVIDPGTASPVLLYDAEALDKLRFDARPPARGRRQYVAGMLAALIIIAAVLYHAAASVKGPEYFIPLIASLLNCGISFVLLFKERNIFNAFTEPFCSSAQFQGCNKILHRRDSVLFYGITLARTGVVCYLSFSLYIVLCPATAMYGGLIYLLSFTAVAASVALVAKMVFIKTFCRLCLWIHAVNVLNGVMLLAINHSASALPKAPGIKACVLFILCFLAASLIASGVLRLIDIIQRAAAAKKETKGLKQELFRHILTKGIDPKLVDTLTGHPPLAIPVSAESDAEITLVLSMKCHFCASLINTIYEERFREKIGILKVYLYAANADSALSQFAAELAGSSSAADKMTLLKTWYADAYMPQLHPPVPGAALPAFCLDTAALPYQELPAVFINSVFMPHRLGERDLETMLYFTAISG
jgi:hypothetical protein